MRSIAQPPVLARLLERIESLQPDSPRRWGTLTAHEMLCHLGDSFELVMDPARGSRRGARFIKYLALYTPVPWPKGVPTLRSVDPRVDGTKPTNFELDRKRAIDGLRAVAEAGDGQFARTHAIFGAMNARDWHRWAFRHTHHHLRQFGL